MISRMISVWNPLVTFCFLAVVFLLDAVLFAVFPVVPLLPYPGFPPTTSIAFYYHRYQDPLQALIPLLSLFITHNYR